MEIYYISQCRVYGVDRKGGVGRWRYTSLEILIYLFPQKNRWIYSVPVGAAMWKN